ncbi:MAG: hypothetical protein ACLPY3_20070 [Solirubrobacteraceae bacterium]
MTGGGPAQAPPKGTPVRWRRCIAPRPGWEHDHCLFCWAKFVSSSEEGKERLAQDEHTIYFEGYATAEPNGSGFDWVCRPCFDDFADELEFVVVGDRSADAS